jgi:hypothetical protein
VLLVPLLAAALSPFDEIELPCVADVSIAAHPSERTFNLGGASRVRIKGTEHVGLFDFDASAVAGRRVESAQLLLHAPVPHRLHVVGVSTVGWPWEEGRSTGEAKSGEVCFEEAARFVRPWPGGDFLGATFGRTDTDWVVAEIREEGEGWLSIPVRPEFVEAIAAGDSHGLAISDEKGQTRWNNDVSSRETEETAPRLRVVLGDGPPRPREPTMRPWSLGEPPWVFEENRSSSPVPRRGRHSLYRKPLPLVGERHFTLAIPGVQPHPARPIQIGTTHPGWWGERLEFAAARGEHLEAALVVEWPEGDELSFRIGWEGAEAVPFRTYVGWYVPAEARPFVDPLVPLPPEGVRLPNRVNGVRGQRTAMFHLEWFVPIATPAGVHEGVLSLVVDGVATPVPVRIEVFDVVLPERPSFVLSLNTYGFPGANLEEERAWFRLAHEHRATLACVPYSQSGIVEEGAAPELATRRGDPSRPLPIWQEWDARFGPLFDGSAFRALPREGVPVDHFFLPLHENWPVPIEGAYRYAGSVGDHWRLAPPIEEAFSEAYARAFTHLAEAFARHVAAKGWTQTRFLGFLNNKVDYRERGRGTSWWRLDEPAYRDDFLALRWFAKRFHEGVARAGGESRLLFRVDLSRPEWRRDLLDGDVDLLVCNALEASGGIALETARRFGEEVWSYGEAPLPGVDGDRCRRWVLDAWRSGADGIVPWQCVGTSESWSRLEPTALLYPPAPGLPEGPYPSFRLKALRRAVLDAELLNLYAAKTGRSRRELAIEFGKDGLEGAFRRDLLEALQR